MANGFGRACAALVAALLLVRALAAPGYMFAPTDHGATVILCTDHGPIKVPSNDPAPRPDGKTGDHFCPFGATAYFTAPGPAPDATAPTQRADRSFFVAALAQAPSHTAALPPPARGPPLLV